jgi:hypothetical protein
LMIFPIGNCIKSSIHSLLAAQQHFFIEHLSNYDNLWP